MLANADNLWFEVGFFTFFAVIVTIFLKKISITDAILCKYNAFFILVGTVEFNHVRIFFPHL